MATFSPIKETDASVADKVWSTETINSAVYAQNNGKLLVATPFFNNDLSLLKDGLVYERTPAEEKEFMRCAADICHFAKFCIIKTPKGNKPIKLRDYQKRYLKHLVDNRLSIFLAPRQTGKTVTTAIFVLWFTLFNINKNTMITGNKRATAVEILQKAKDIYVNLPYFLKCGTKKWNEGSIVLDNGCKIMTSATTKNAAIGYTLDLVVADEFAHVAENIAVSFYSNIFPTISAGRYRFVICSTQNGKNLFYRLWTAAESGKSEYAPFTVHWSEVPEWDEKTQKFVPRDEAWRQKMIENIGSEESFEAQYGTHFAGTANTLISSDVLATINEYCKQTEYSELKTFGFYNCRYWRIKHEEIENLMYNKSGKYLMTIDLAEGIGGDYTVFNLFKVTFPNLSQTQNSIPGLENLPPGMVKITDGENEIDPNKEVVEQVGVFATNNTDTQSCAKSLKAFIDTFRLNSEQLVISFERNIYGDLFYKFVHNDLNMSGDYFVKYPSGTGSNTQLVAGLKMTSSSKKNACAMAKMYIEGGRIKITDHSTHMEFESFCDKGNGSFAAIGNNHDDLAMTVVQLGYMLESLRCKTYIEYARQYHLMSLNPGNQNNNNYGYNDNYNNDDYQEGMSIYDMY